MGTKRTAKPPRDTEFGALVRAKRKADNLSLRVAGSMVDVEHSSLSELERGMRAPDFGTIAKISGGLKIPLDELARAAARDLGYEPATTEEAYRALAVSLSSRAQMYPDLHKILDHLSRTDPDRYRAFLVMFQTWDQEDRRGREPQS